MNIDTHEFHLYFSGICNDVVLHGSAIPVFHKTTAQGLRYLFQATLWADLRRTYPAKRSNPEGLRMRLVFCLEKLHPKYRLYSLRTDVR